jgi:hypothetical protein
MTTQVMSANSVMQVQKDSSSRSKMKQNFHIQWHQLASETMAPSRLRWRRRMQHTRLFTTRLAATSE